MILALFTMEKHKFRLSGMMQNSWLNKLREMAKPASIRNRAITSKQSEEKICNSPKRKISPPSPSNSKNYTPNRASQYLPSKERIGMLSKLPSQQIKAKPKSNAVSTVLIQRKSPHDIIFEKGSTSRELELRPIRTKPTNRGNSIKARSISSRCNSRDKQRRWLSESTVEVKYSTDPEKDFMESIMDMILEKNIAELKDLEDLSACYLSLNSREQHDVILKVFQKIWAAFKV